MKDQFKEAQKILQLCESASACQEVIEIMEFRQGHIKKAATKLKRRFCKQKYFLFAESHKALARYYASLKKYHKALKHMHIILTPGSLPSAQGWKSWVQLVQVLRAMKATKELNLRLGCMLALWPKKAKQIRKFAQGKITPELTNSCFKFSPQ